LLTVRPAFAAAPDAAWSGNFRDLAAAVTRMATFAPAGRIDVAAVAAEAERLRRLWAGVAGGSGAGEGDGLDALLAAEALAALDPFDRVQLAEVVRTCRRARSLSEAGRTLFAASRTRRSSSNDADRLRKYLHRFGLGWADLAG
jgi:transcriptional regulatory protein RtcR